MFLLSLLTGEQTEILYKINTINSENDPELKNIQSFLNKTTNDCYIVKYITNQFDKSASFLYLCGIKLADFHV